MIIVFIHLNWLNQIQLLIWSLSNEAFSSTCAVNVSSLHVSSKSSVCHKSKSHASTINLIACFVFNVQKIH